MPAHLFFDFEDFAAVVEYLPMTWRLAKPHWKHHEVERVESLALAKIGETPNMFAECMCPNLQTVAPN